MRPAPKVPAGQRPLKVERRERAAARQAHERREKAAVRARDGRRCRVPWCVSQQMDLHVAHLDDKGMGGDKRGLRTQRARMLCLCWAHHQGAVSLHAKTLRVEPLTERGTDGLCEFAAQDISGEWILMSERVTPWA